MHELITNYCFLFDIFPLAFSFLQPYEIVVYKPALIYCSTQTWLKRFHSIAHLSWSNLARRPYSSRGSSYNFRKDVSHVPYRCSVIPMTVFFAYDEVVGRDTLYISSDISLSLMDSWLGDRGPCGNTSFSGLYISNNNNNILSKDNV